MITARSALSMGLLSVELSAVHSSQFICHRGFICRDVGAVNCVASLHRPFLAACVGLLTSLLAECSQHEPATEHDKALDPKRRRKSRRYTAAYITVQPLLNRLGTSAAHRFFFLFFD